MPTGIYRTGGPAYSSNTPPPLTHSQYVPSPKMPRFSSYRRPSRRSYRSRRPTSRRYPRRLTRTKRTYRRSRMSKRKVIDTVSLKKHDVYLSASAAGDNPVPTGSLVLGAPARLFATPTNANYGNIHAFLHVPTHKYLSQDGPQSIAARTSTRPWLRGFKEMYRLTPNDASVWWHRRIVFAAKGNPFFKTGNSNGIVNFVGAEQSPTDLSLRQFRDLTGQSTGEYTTALDKTLNYLYDGVYQVDWIDPFTASTDKTRLTIISDRFQRIKSDNQAPAPVHRKHYTNIGKTIQYDDEQNGLGMSTNPLSTDAKPGIGDIYVYDLFGCPAPVTGGNTPGSSLLQVSSTATLYWHEK